MLADEAIQKLHDIFRVFIGDSADEWRTQKQQGSFESENLWAEHLLAVHKRFCQDADCQLNRCALQLFSSDNMDLSMKKRSPINNNDDVQGVSRSSPFSHLHASCGSWTQTRTEIAQPRVDPPTKPVTAHRGVCVTNNDVAPQTLTRCVVQPIGDCLNLSSKNILDLSGSTDEPLNCSKHSSSHSDTDHDVDTVPGRSDSPRPTPTAATSLLAQLNPMGDPVPASHGALPTMAPVKSVAPIKESPEHSENAVAAPPNTTRLASILSAADAVKSVNNNTTAAVKRRWASSSDGDAPHLEVETPVIKDEVASPRDCVLSPRCDNASPFLTGDASPHRAMLPNAGSVSLMTGSRKSRRKNRHPTSIKEMIPCGNEEEEYEGISQFKIRKREEGFIPLAREILSSSVGTDISDDYYDGEEEGYYGNPNGDLDNYHNFHSEKELHEQMGSGDRNTKPVVYYNCLICYQSFKSHSEMQCHIATHVIRENLQLKVSDGRLEIKTKTQSDRFDPDMSPHRLGFRGNHMVDDDEAEGTVSCLVCQKEVSTLLYEDHLRSHKHSGQWSERKQRISGARIRDNSPYLTITDKIKTARANIILNSIRSHKEQMINSNQSNVRLASEKQPVATMRDDERIKRSNDSSPDGGNVAQNTADRATIDTKDLESFAESVSAFKKLAAAPQTFRLNFDKNFPCELCAKRFSSKRLLTVHMKSHSDERPHACMVCGKTFKHSSHKRRHENQHFNRLDASSEDPSDAFIETITVDSAAVSSQ